MFIKRKQSDFDHLSISNKCCLLHANGQKLCTMQEAGEAFDLYWMDNYFVEVNFTLPGRSVEGIKLLSTADVAEKYWEMLPMPALP